MIYVVALCRLVGGVPVLGKCIQADSWEGAVEAGIRLAINYGKTTVSDEEVRQELVIDGNYFDPDDRWSVCIWGFGGLDD